MTKKLKWALIIVVLIVYFGSTVSNSLEQMANGLRKTADNISASKIQTEKPTVSPSVDIKQDISTNQKAIQVTAKQIEQDYGDNQFSADAKYKGKLIEVTGAIIEVGRDFSNKPFIKFAANDNRLIAVWCEFNENEASSLAKVNKDHAISVLGTCDGIDKQVYLKDCKVTNISSEPIQVNKSESLLYKVYNSQN